MEDLSIHSKDNIEEIRSELLSNKRFAIVNVPESKDMLIPRPSEKDIQEQFDAVLDLNNPTFIR